MPRLRIEMDRGKGWETRGEGDIVQEHATYDTLRAELCKYSRTQYVHRALLADESGHFVEVVRVTPREARKGLRPV